MQPICYALSCPNKSMPANAFCYKHWIILPRRYKDQFKQPHNERHYQRLLADCRRQIRIIETNHDLENYPFYPNP